MGFKILKFDPWTLTKSLLGNFITHETGLAKVYPYIKFEVSIASPIPDLRKGF